MPPPKPNLDAASNAGDDEIPINDAILLIFKMLAGLSAKQLPRIHQTFPLKLLLIEYSVFNGQRTLRRLFTPVGQIRLLSGGMLSDMEDITTDFDKNAGLCLEDVSRTTPWCQPERAAEALGEAKLYRVKGISGKPLVGFSDEYSELSTPVAELEPS